MREESGIEHGTIAISIAQAIRRILAPDLRFRLSPISAAREPLFPRERGHVANACSKRRREFRAGRSVARQALLDLGYPRVELPPVPMSGPHWPEGFVGSISHSAIFAAALVAERPPWAGLGVDVEEPGRVGPELERLIVTSEERQRLGSHGAPLPCGYLGFLFSAKEAIYKACGKRFGIGASFLELEIDEIGSSSFCFRLNAEGRWTSPRHQFGGWIFEAGHLVCVAGVADEL